MMPSDGKYSGSGELIDRQLRLQLRDAPSLECKFLRVAKSCWRSPVMQSKQAVTFSAPLMRWRFLRKLH
jgi:hypothetical protein